MKTIMLQRKLPVSGSQMKWRTVLEFIPPQLDDVVVFLDAAKVIDPNVVWRFVERPGQSARPVE